MPVVFQYYGSLRSPFGRGVLHFERDADGNPVAIGGIDPGSGPEGDSLTTVVYDDGVAKQFPGWVHPDLYFGLREGLPEPMYEEEVVS